MSSEDSSIDIYNIERKLSYYKRILNDLKDRTEDEYKIPTSIVETQVSNIERYFEAEIKSPGSQNKKNILKSENEIRLAILKIYQMYSKPDIEVVEP